MTRNLRKRHLAMWIAVTVILVILIVYARMYVPQFKGDEPTIESEK